MFFASVLIINPTISVIIREKRKNLRFIAVKGKHVN